MRMASAWRLHGMWRSGGARRARGGGSGRGGVSPATHQCNERTPDDRRRRSGALSRRRNLVAHALPHLHSFSARNAPMSDSACATRSRHAGSPVSSSSAAERRRRASPLVPFRHWRRRGMGELLQRHGPGLGRSSQEPDSLGRNRRLRSPRANEESVKKSSFLSEVMIATQ
jgi:hypothetical protein